MPTPRPCPAAPLLPCHAGYCAAARRWSAARERGPRWSRTTASCCRPLPTGGVGACMCAQVGVALHSPNIHLRGMQMEHAPPGIAAGTTAAAACAAVGPCRPLAPLPRRVEDNLNIGDAMDYGQGKHGGSLGNLVLATLQRLERSGGPGEQGGGSRQAGMGWATCPAFAPVAAQHADRRFTNVGPSFLPLQRPSCTSRTMLPPTRAARGPAGWRASRSGAARRWRPGLGICRETERP